MPTVPVVPGGLIDAALQGAVLTLCKVGGLRHHIGALLQGSHQAHDQLQDAAQHLADAEVQRDRSSGWVVPIRLQQSGLQRRKYGLRNTPADIMFPFRTGQCVELLALVVPIWMLDQTGTTTRTEQASNKHMCSMLAPCPAGASCLSNMLLHSHHL